MEKKYMFMLTLTGLSLAPLSVNAQDSQIDILEHQLQERDKVIMELLERVEALEQRVGVSKSPTSHVENSKRPETTASKPSETDGMPGAITVSSEDAERALERSLTRDGAVLLSPGTLEIQPSLSYSHNSHSTPAIVSYNGSNYTGQTERKSDNFTADLAFRLGLPKETQLEIGIPYRWRDVKSVDSIGFVPTDSSGTTGSGFGDLRIGFAKTLLHEGLWQPDLVGRITWDTDTGDKNDGNLSLGGGYHELQASLNMIKRQDPMVFSGGLSYQYTFEDEEIQPGATYLANFGSYIALSPETSLSFILSAGYQEETRLSNTPVPGSDRTLGTLNIGGSTLLARGTLLNFNTGIGLTEDSDDFTLSFSLPIRLDKKIF